MPTLFVLGALLASPHASASGRPIADAKFARSLHAAPEADVSPAVAADAVPDVHAPRALTRVLRAIVRARDAGETPVLLFDIDDTLVRARGRNMRIMRELAADPALRARFGSALDALAGPDPNRMRYHFKESLRAHGLADEGFLAAATAFWEVRFFEREYLPEDPPVPGAKRFLEECLALGGVIVYFTGRWEDMRLGTLDALARWGLPPPDGRSVHLVMKPRKEMKDADFKDAALKDISRLGTVVAGFENEPKHVNMFKRFLPSAHIVFLDTSHSAPMDEAGRPLLPLPGIAWVKDYLGYQTPARAAERPTAPSRR